MPFYVFTIPTDLSQAAVFSIAVRWIEKKSCDVLNLVTS